MRSTLKRFLAAIGVLFLATLMNGVTTVNAAKDNQEKFSKATIEINENMEIFYDLIGETIQGKELDNSKIMTVASQVATNAEILVQIGQEDKAKYIWDANQIALHANELQEMLAEKNYAEAMCAASHIPIHNHNAQLLNPIFLRDALTEEVEELNKALDEVDVNWDEIHEIYEHLALHSNQITIASSIFGKKVWVKFIDEFRTVTDKLHEPLENKDSVAAKSIAKDFEKPLNLLVQLIK